MDKKLSLSILSATRADLELLNDVAKRSKAHWGYPQDWMETWRDILEVSDSHLTSEIIYKAVDPDEELLGYYRLALENGRWMLAGFWVLPAVMGRGIGRTLFEHCCATAKSQGAAKLEWESDPNALPFYETVGGTTVGTKEYRLHGDRRVLPLMEYDLADTEPPSYRVFNFPPIIFHPSHIVVACFIEADSEVLFVRRVRSTHQGGRWSVPGGKADAGESAEEAVIREVREETEIALEAGSLRGLGTLYVWRQEVSYSMHLFAKRFSKRPPMELNLAEHDQCRWLSIDESKGFSLIEGGQEAIRLYESCSG